MKVAVIGTGFMGTVHLETYSRMPNIDIKGVVDVDADRLNRAAERFGAKGFSSVVELLDECQIDAVSVCTSDDRHREAAVQCLRAGVPVLLEKPIATNIDDADAIIAAADESGAHLLIGHILRFEQRYCLAKSSIDNGEIGSVVSIFSRRLNAASFQARLKGRTSVLAFLGVHDFDVCNWIAGSKPVRVFAESRRGYLESLGYPVEDQVFTTLRYENEVIACVESGWILPDQHPRKGDFGLEIIGTEGVINLELMQNGISVCGRNGYSYPPASHGIEGELAHFRDCVEGRARPAVDGRAGRAALEITLAAIRAAGEGAVVKL